MKLITVITDEGTFGLNLDLVQQIHVGVNRLVFVFSPADDYVVHVTTPAKALERVFEVIRCGNWDLDLRPYQES